MGCVHFTTGSSDSIHVTPWISKSPMMIHAQVWGLPKREKNADDEPAETHVEKYAREQQEARDEADKVKAEEASAAEAEEKMVEEKTAAESKVKAAVATPTKAAESPKSKGSKGRESQQPRAKKVD